MSWLQNIIIKDKEYLVIRIETQIFVIIDFRKPRRMFILAVNSFFFFNEYFLIFHREKIKKKNVGDTILKRFRLVFVNKKVKGGTQFESSTIAGCIKVGKNVNKKNLFSPCSEGKAVFPGQLDGANAYVVNGEPCSTEP